MKFNTLKLASLLQLHNSLFVQHCLPKAQKGAKLHTWLPEARRTLLAAHQLVSHVLHSHASNPLAHLCKEGMVCMAKSGTDGRDDAQTGVESSSSA